MEPELAQPALDTYDDGFIGFEFEATMPGPGTPRPSIIKLVEVWAPVRPGRYALAEYGYDFIEYPMNRRRAFHRHDEVEFLREFGVAVHEHCEEVLGRRGVRSLPGTPRAWR